MRNVSLCLISACVGITLVGGGAMAVPMGAALPAVSSGSLRVSDVYEYQPTLGGVIQELQEHTPYFRLYHLRIPGANSTPGHTQWIQAEYYEPRQSATPYPAVILLPHRVGFGRFERFLCEGLAKRGVAAVYVHAPYVTGSSDQAENFTGQPGSSSTPDTEDMLREARQVRESVISARQIADWLDRQPEIVRSRYGIVGVRFGGNVAALAAGVDGRFSASAHVVGWRALTTLLHEGAVTRRVRWQFQQLGLRSPARETVWFLFEQVNRPATPSGASSVAPALSLRWLASRAMADTFWFAVGQSPSLGVLADRVATRACSHVVRSRVVRHFQQALL